MSNVGAFGKGSLKQLQYSSQSKTCFPTAPSRLHSLRQVASFAELVYNCICNVRDCVRQPTEYPRAWGYKRAKSIIRSRQALALCPPEYRIHRFFQTNMFDFAYFRGALPRWLCIIHQRLRWWVSQNGVALTPLHKGFLHGIQHKLVLNMLKVTCYKDPGPSFLPAGPANSAASRRVQVIPVPSCSHVRGRFARSLP